MDTLSAIDIIDGFGDKDAKRPIWNICARYDALRAVAIAPADDAKTKEEEWAVGILRSNKSSWLMHHEGSSEIETFDGFLKFVFRLQEQIDFVLGLEARAWELIREHPDSTLALRYAAVASTTYHRAMDSGLKDMMIQHQVQTTGAVERIHRREETERARRLRWYMLEFFGICLAVASAIVLALNYGPFRLEL